MKLTSAILRRKFFAVSAICAFLIAPVFGLERLEPSEGCYLGFILSPEETVSRLSSRLGITPAVSVRFFNFPLSDSDRESLNRFLDDVTQFEGIAMLTLQPSQGLDAITESVCADLANICATFESQGIGGVFIRFGHEMNGNWYAWGQQPLLYKSKFRLFAENIHLRTARTAMVWAPNYGIGYPFGTARPMHGSPDFLALDTDHNGIVSDRDDMYEPYYPGDDAVDWVGLTLYHWGIDYPWFENEIPPANSFAKSLIGLYQGNIPNFYDRYCAEPVRNKPMVIAETAAFYNTQVSGADEFEIKRAWWRQLFNISGDNSNALDVASHFPKLKCINWFDEYKQESVAQNNWIDWRVSADLRIRSAFVGDVRTPRNGHPYFLSAQEAHCLDPKNCITANDLPAILPLTGRINVSLNIKAETNCDLVVDLLNQNFHWQGGMRVPVTSGEKSVSSNFQLNQSLVDGAEYRWSVFLTRRGGDYLSAIAWYKGPNPIAREIKPGIRILAHSPLAIAGSNVPVRFKYTSAQPAEARIRLLDEQFNPVASESILLARGDGVTEVSFHLATTILPGIYWLEGSLFGSGRNLANIVAHSERSQIRIERVLKTDALTVTAEPAIVPTGEVFRFVAGYAATTSRQLRVLLCDAQSNLLASAVRNIPPGCGITDLTISYPNANPERYLVSAFFSEDKLEPDRPIVSAANQNVEVVSSDYLDWIESEWGVVLGTDPVSPADDPDQDGAANQDEFLAGTRPRDSSDTFAMEIQKNGSGLVAIWPSKVGHLYQLHGTSNFAHWAPASDLISGTGQIIRIPLESTEPSAPIFYRIHLVDQRKP